ncbi:GAF domain-containing protein [Nocardioides glacieisoli]|jgi:signal transduction histidine kinase|uniref:GAF domain-containing protein n=1 Tax=Nocardioides glacieisoli TaxID=1168730 RepID=A0A4Q2RI53_9ACTN|nr:GAF domain-containing protein [Nocardioides glacieisoli]RYB88401.1 GAF domain-containing protein [Nocardioides glacieisoli]
MEHGEHGQHGDEPALGAVAFDDLLREVLARMDGALDQQARLRLLLDAVVTMAGDLTLDGVLARIVAVAGQLVDAQYAALGVLASGTGRGLRTFVHHGMATEVVTRIGELPTGHGLLGLLIDDPRPIRLHDIAAHPVSYGFPANHPPMRSFLGVPIRIRDKVFGNLYLTEKAGGGDFTDIDQEVVVALAAAAGVVIENATLYEEAEHRQAWLTATAETVALLAGESEAEHALQAVADRARAVSGADVSWVVTGSDGAALRLEVVSGAPVDLDAMQRLRMEDSLASLVVRSGEAVAVEDVAADARAVDPSSIDGWPRLGPVMVVPLRSGRGVEGVLSLAWTKANAEGFRRVDPALPASFAEQATLALQVARSRTDQARLIVFEDRDRIGQDLHDLVIQRLFAVGLGLQSVANMTRDPQVTPRLEQAIDDLDGTIKDIRRTIFSLGAMEQASDVQSEIERLVDRAGATMKLRPRLTIDGPLRTAVAPAVVPDLLAVLGEALTNVTRHARAGTVHVHVRVDASCVSVRVADDGQGMDLDAPQSGLDNMRKRAIKHGGDVEVESAPGSGTTVTWTVPSTPHAETP